MFKVNDEIEKSKILYLLNDVFNLDELSYEKIIHNKVSNWDFHLAIPEGKNMLVWFVYYDNENVCFLLELSKNKEVKNIYKALLSFSDYLCNGDGTILYGKLVNFNVYQFKNIKCVSIEDIYIYRGENVSHKLFSKKLNLFKTIFNNDILQVVLSQQMLLLGLCLMSNNLNELLKKMVSLPYKLKGIQFRTEKKKEILLMIQYQKLVGSACKNQNHITHNQNHITHNQNHITHNQNHITHNQNHTKTFMIVPDIQNDIYNLYNINNNTYYDVALIPDYKTSVMMNNLFRNIKENINLDLLEESDDEEEFENSKMDKFVDLKKRIKMNCVFNYKFKKWCPISIFE
jgi:hypothetical protein